MTARGAAIKMVDLEESYPAFDPIAIPVRVQFITQADVFAGGETTLQYHAALCGGCSFDGLNARFAVNLVNNPWDDDAGDTITVHAKDSAGNIIATNLGSDKKPMPDFNFTYTMK